MSLSERLRAAIARATLSRLSIPGYHESAVLVPIVERAGHASVLFIVRPDDMPTHAGHVAFPGGRRAPDDADLAATALRESHEELGIAPDTVELLGALDDTATPVGFVITPVVGWLRDPAPFRPAPREVASWFEVPVETLAEPAHYKDGGTREFQGQTYQLHEYHVGGRVVWGATARIVWRLLELLG